MQACNRESSQHTCCSLDALHSFVYKQFFYLHHVLHLCPAEVIELPDRSIDDLGQLTWDWLSCKLPKLKLGSA